MLKAVILQSLPAIPEINVKEAVGEVVNQLFNRFAFIVPLVKIIGWLLAALIVLKILFIIGRFFREGKIIKLLNGISNDISQIRNKFAPESKEKEDKENKKTKK